MPENKIDIDKKDNKEYDYLEEMEKFTNKDILLSSLQQEWVKTRFNEPKSKILIHIGLLIAISMLIYKLILIEGYPKDIILQGIFIFMMVCYIVAFFVMIYENFQIKDNKMKKLRAIREAINHFS